MMTIKNNKEKNIKAINNLPVLENQGGIQLTMMKARKVKKINENKEISINSKRKAEAKEKLMQKEKQKN